jgi:hypothetical protein
VQGGAHAHVRTFELERVRRPALLKGHDIRHGLAAATDARDAEGRPLKIGDALVCGLCARDDCPVRSIGVSWTCAETVANVGRETNLTVC